MNDMTLNTEIDRATFIGGSELRDIPGYEGTYAITKDGRILAYARTWVTGNNLQIRRSHPEIWLRTHQSSRGYVSANLCHSNSKISIHVHRLVAMSWIPNPLALPQVNHINGIKSDNRVENLEWNSASENKIHAHRTGLVHLDSKAFLESVRRNVKAAHAATRKLTIEQATSARLRFKKGEKKTQIAASLGIARATLDSLLKGETYGY